MNKRRELIKNQNVEAQALKYVKRFDLAIDLKNEVLRLDEEFRSTADWTDGTISREKKQFLVGVCDQVAHYRRGYIPETLAKSAMVSKCPDALSALFNRVNEPAVIKALLSNAKVRGLPSTQNVLLEYDAKNRAAVLKNTKIVLQQDMLEPLAQEIDLNEVDPLLQRLDFMANDRHKKRRNAAETCLDILVERVLERSKIEPYLSDSAVQKFCRNPHIAFGGASLLNLAQNVPVRYLSDLAKNPKTPRFPDACVEAIDTRMEASRDSANSLSLGR